ncbi:MAG: cytochrome c3 family protein [Bryobacterales bacterium]|nr:cytochrome c3 family protein [Bryobacterales bacterium]
MTARLLLLALAGVAAYAQQPKLHEVCGACHTEAAADFQEHIHFSTESLQCDACHGESQPHREATGHKPPDRVAGPAEQPAVCGRCHTTVRKEYETSKHWQRIEARSEKRAAACTTCHGTHAVRAPAAMAAQCNRCHTELPASCKREPALVNGKPVCASCHSPHGLSVRR